MAQKRWWPATRTVLVAHLFGVIVIGVCQFAITSVWDPRACCPVGSPWDLLCDWDQSGRKRPLVDVFNRFEIHRFCATLAGLVFVGVGLGWSIRSMRPFRLTARFRLRTLMAVIAIVPLECVAGADVWNGWKQWDYDQRFAGVAGRRSSGEDEVYLQAGDTLSVEVHDALLKQPINGVRTVHSDGKIDLGCYGRVYVAGLTIAETKEKIILRVRPSLANRGLGLTELSLIESLAAVRRICSEGSLGQDRD
jgi:hypothetical protein